MIITNRLRSPVNSNKKVQRNVCGEEGRTNWKPADLNSGAGSAFSQLVTFSKELQFSALRGLKEMTFRVFFGSNSLLDSRSLRKTHKKGKNLP